MALSVFTLVFGFGLLVGGTDLLTRGVAFLTGVHVPGLGSTLAGLAFCLAAVQAGHPELALGTVLGRGCAAIAAVLGTAALVRPLLVSRGVMRGGIAVTITASLAFWGLTADNALNRADGVLLLVGFVGFVVWVGWLTRWRPPRLGATRPVPLWVPVVQLVLAAVMFAGGVYWTVDVFLGVTDGESKQLWLIGLTAGGAGTVLPGVVKAVEGMVSGRADDVYRGVVAGAVLNLLLVLGVTVVANPVRLSSGVVFREVPAVVLFGLLLVPPLATGCRVGRGGGLVLLAAYAAFVAWEVSRAR